MSIRVTLRSPIGETVVRDIVDGHWAEPLGEADTHVGDDLWALPGLVDAHAHLAVDQLEPKPGDLAGAAARARAALAAGVMLILDKGWCDTTALEVIATVAEVERPEIEAAARIIAVANGYYPGFGREVDASSLAAVVEEEAVNGAGWVKLVGDWPRRGRGPLPNFTEDELRLVVEIAENAGSRVAIHTMAPDVPSNAVAAGVHSIEHGLFLTEDDLGALGDREGMWVPTVMRAEALVGQLGAGSSGGRLFLEGLSNVKRLIPLALEAGVHVLAGTDLVASPAGITQEAFKLAEYGMTDREVVHALAMSPFLATGRPTQFAEGAFANAVLFPDDPTQDLSVLAAPSVVIRLGALN